jgi:hypothetical protein
MNFSAMLPRLLTLSECRVCVIIPNNPAAVRSCISSLGMSKRLRFTVKFQLQLVATHVQLIGSINLEANSTV